MFQELINKYGNQAYHIAIHWAVVATRVGDKQGAELYSRAAKELMELGYHKFSETQEQNVYQNWNSIPDGARVIEDTYNEVYEVFTKDGQKWLKQVGWQIGDKPVPDNCRPCDFDPQCIYDQPWIELDKVPPPFMGFQRKE